MTSQSQWITNVCGFLQFIDFGGSGFNDSDRAIFLFFVQFWFYWFRCSKFMERDSSLLFLFSIFIYQFWMDADAVVADETAIFRGEQKKHCQCERIPVAVSRRCEYIIRALYEMHCFLFHFSLLLSPSLSLSFLSKPLTQQNVQFPIIYFNLFPLLPSAECESLIRAIQLQTCDSVDTLATRARVQQRMCIAIHLFSIFLIEKCSIIAASSLGSPSLCKMNRLNKTNSHSRPSNTTDTSFIASDRNDLWWKLIRWTDPDNLSNE